MSAASSPEAAAAEPEVPEPSRGPLANIYLVFYAFNQDCSCFVCGTTAGFRVYRIEPSPPRELLRRENVPAFQQRSVVLISMLFRTNIYAMVTAGEDEPDDAGRHLVQIWDDSKGKFLGELRSRHEVTNVVMRRDIIAMVCDCNVYIYTLDKLKHIHSVATAMNPRGLCSLAIASTPWVLCCPGPSVGTVRVQVGGPEEGHVIGAHETALAALALNESGSRIATASENGTVVKVFQRTDGHVLYRLRIGAPANGEMVSCVAFHPNDGFLAVAASSSSVVHVFKLELAEPSGDAEGDSAAAEPCAGGGSDASTSPRGGGAALGLLGWTKKLTSIAKGVLPDFIKDSRSFARFQLPDVDPNGQPTFDVRSKSARISGPLLAFHRTELELFVLHHSGLLYQCAFRDGSDGSQECGLKVATTWFAVRPDFRMLDSSRVATVAGGVVEGEDDAEDWQVV